MKDWKTYAIIALAAWCAWMTFKPQTDSPRGVFATEQYARKCAIATALMVWGPSKDNREMICDLNESVSDYGAEIDSVLSMTKEERDEIIKDAREKHKAAIEKMKARRVIGGMSTNSQSASLFSSGSLRSIRNNEKEKEIRKKKAEERERILAASRKRDFDEWADRKKNSPEYYERRIKEWADRLEYYEKNYPIHYQEELERLKEVRPDFFFADVQEYRRKHKNQ